MNAIKAAREPERTQLARNTNSETQARLELQYIADALEGIRQDLQGLTHAVAAAARAK
jgi:hypothetical protein